MRVGVTASAVVTAALLVVAAINSTRWIGSTVPGFFLMANRVVASIALPDWLEVDPSRLFQHQVLAVDDVPVSTAAAVYTHVGSRPPGTPIRYTLRAPGGETSTLVVRSRRFTAVDYALVFGAYFFNGLAFAGTALLVYLLKPRNAPSRALLVAGLATGVFIITAADLYGPHWFFRLHVVAESLMGAGFLHLALVFPTDRLRRHRRAVLAAVYLPLVALAGWYEVVLASPAAYTTAHLLATAAQGVAATAIIAAIVYDFVMSRSPLVRRRTSVVVLGSLVGFVVPGTVMLESAFVGGKVPLNAAALTAFLFPLSVGYAVVKRDLFDIDLMLRRTVACLALVITMATVHFAAATRGAAGRSSAAASPPGHARNDCRAH
jgi:hypothetical protein